MIINGDSLLLASPIKNMIGTKQKEHGVSYGLTESGYDIRIKQDIKFEHRTLGTVNGIQKLLVGIVDGIISGQGFCLASSIEEFNMPNNLMAQVLNKSTWARKGLDASMTTNIEPGWKGFLTLELIYHGSELLHIPAGSGIAQVLFHEVSNPAVYSGKYQNQQDGIVNSIFEGD